MLKGIPVSQGIGIGKAFTAKAAELAWTSHPVSDSEAEIKRLHQALESFNQRTEALIKAAEAAAAETAGAEAENGGAADTSHADILRGHMAMVGDPFMLSQMEEQINTGVCAEDACDSVLSMFEEMFSQTDDELTQQRAADVRDIKKRVLGILTGAEEVSLSLIPEGAVLIAEELTPSMLAEIPKGHLVGVVTEKGGATAHSAILLRAAEIPGVYSVENALECIKDGDIVIVDGTEGHVSVNPSAEETARCEACCREAAERKALLTDYRNKDTRMADGQRREVYANIGSSSEAEIAASGGAEGIGLFRTEFLFTDTVSAPDEEAQFQAYKAAAEALRGKPVIIRTLDIGGDKQIPYLNMGQEANPFLGFRAVRYCLENRALYETQLRAVLRASAYGNLKLMIPLVTSVEEVRQVKAMVRELMGQLRAEKIAFDENLQIGVMMETPAACQIADLLAKESDFFSIGTNDLVQYTMASDRGNPKVAYLNRPYHPAVLRSVRRIIQCGTEAGIPVGMCGEAAADPLMTPLLLAFGLQEFSVTPPAVTRIRAQIAQWSGEEAALAAQEAMKMETAEDVKQYLERIVREK